MGITRDSAGEGVGVVMLTLSRSVRSCPTDARISPGRECFGTCDGRCGGGWGPRFTEGWMYDLDVRPGCATWMYDLGGEVSGVMRIVMGIVAGNGCAGAGGN